MPFPDEYYFKDFEYRRGNRTSVVYTVAKFNYRRYPEVIYEVKQGRFGWECTCPAHTNHGVICKHITMIREWIQNGKPSPFDHLLQVSKKPTKSISSKIHTKTA